MMFFSGWESKPQSYIAFSHHFFSVYFNLGHFFSLSLPFKAFVILVSKPVTLRMSLNLGLSDSSSGLDSYNEFFPRNTTEVRVCTWCWFVLLLGMVIFFTWLRYYLSDLSAVKLISKCFVGCYFEIMEICSSSIFYSLA